MNKRLLQEIMKKAYKAYEQAHKLPCHVRNAAHALMKCRTAELGGHVQACPEGHYQRHWYNSCRHRVCPQCNWLQIEQWLQRQKERLLRCGHYHMIFTLPHELNPIWLLNVRKMTNLLFSCVRDTLFEFFLDTRHVGGRPGIIAALHTWSQTMVLHPHVHCLVTDGGFSNELQWAGTRQQGYLLPVRAVMLVFRGKFLAYLNNAVEKERIALPAEMTLLQWKGLRNKLAKKKWNVHIREKYEHGDGILIYLSRYIRGGAMSNRRIMSFTEQRVAFRHRSTEACKGDIMTLSVDEFIRRYLLHVPEPHTKVVRSYGLYAPISTEALSICRVAFVQDTVRESDVVDWQSFCETRGDEHPERCPICGCRLIRVMEIPRVPGYDKDAIPKAA